MLRALGSIVIAVLFATEVQAEDYPLDYWARRAAVGVPTLSPDGSKFALLRIMERGGNPVIEVYETDKLDEEPRRINSDPMEIIFLGGWITNDILLFSARQQVRDQIDGFNQGTYERKNAFYDHSKSKLGQIRQPYFSPVGRLKGESNKILISIIEGVPDGLQGGTSQSIRRGYYEYDVKRNRKKLLARATRERRSISFDGEGNATHASGYVQGKTVWYWRPKGTKDWEKMFERDKDNFESFSVWGPDPQKEDHYLVRAHNGNDKAGIWSYDARNRRFGELLYRRSDVDAGGVFGHSNRMMYPDTPAGISWCKDKCYREFFDPNEEALYRQLSEIIPNAGQITVYDRSEDGNTLIVVNDAPRDPGSYYLIRNGRITKIGGAKPYLEYDELSNVEYITYKARDGRKISGYVTVPKGEGPFPLIVMPHGGPYVSETIDGFDEWSQMLAHYGYMVLQPQYRGSRKYGLDFYQSAFINGSESGRAMQDDKDDGALFLVKEGRVDADKIAMFGWSYGGYAALIAASRENQIYQCAIAGAAVTDPEWQLDQYRYRMDGIQKTEQLTTWDGAVSPIKEVDKVNIPLFIIHGDNDQRVPPDHYFMYVDALEKAGIPYKKLLLEKADHFSNTLFYHHKMDLYDSMLQFFEGECGLKDTGAGVASVLD